MSRPLAALIAAACIAVLVLAGINVVSRWKAASLSAASAKAHDCASAERQLAAVKAGRPDPAAEPEAVVRLVVWGCRGKPAGMLPADL